MYYKVWSKHKRCHLWTWEDFKTEINGKIVKYDASSVIKWIIYSVDNKIPQYIFDKYELNYKIVDKSEL